MTNNHSIWNIPEVLAALAQSVKDKWSARQAAPYISKIAGRTLSRNAVLGAAHRRGMPFRSDDAGQYDRKHKQTRNKLVYTAYSPSPHNYISPKQPPEQPSQTEFLGLTILDLPENGCRYPAGDRIPYLFCGQPQWNESSYCEHHHRICNTGIPPYKKQGESRVVFGTSAGPLQNGPGRSRGIP